MKYKNNIPLIPIFPIGGWCGVSLCDSHANSLHFEKISGSFIQSVFICVHLCPLKKSVAALPRWG